MHLHLSATVWVGVRGGREGTARPRGDGDGPTGEANDRGMRQVMRQRGPTPDSKGTSGTSWKEKVKGNLPAVMAFSFLQRCVHLDKFAGGGG